METAIADPESVSRIAPQRSDGPLVAAARAAESTAHDVRERVARAGERLARRPVGEIVEDGRRVVREHPVTAVLAAAAAGAVVGWFLARRRP